MGELKTIHEECILCLANEFHPTLPEMEDAKRFDEAMLIPEDIHRTLCFLHRRAVEDVAKQSDEYDASR